MPAPEALDYSTQQLVELFLSNENGPSGWRFQLALLIVERAGIKTLPDLVTAVFEGEDRHDWLAHELERAWETRKKERRRAAQDSLRPTG